MQEKQIRDAIEQVKSGDMPRRAFIEAMVGVGLTAPMASMMLMHAGVAQAQPSPVYKPTKKGGGGALKVLWWQGATLLQPHFANGTKDQEGSRIFYEPLAVWDNDGNLVPILAAEIPTRENGGVAADGKSVTWKLKRNVTWHDGKPFTADDCVFTWEYAKDPATAAVTIAVFKDVVVTKVDNYTVKVAFQKPTPFWATAFVAAEGMIIPKHVFAPYIGGKSRDAPGNLKPVGTGPYKFVDFKPGDLVSGVAYDKYHMPNRPFFDSIEMKGGGDAASAARAVLQTGEYEYAWNLQVEDEVLKRMEDGGKGRAHIIPSGDIEFIQLNLTDPWNEVEGERASIKSKHFAFTDPAVREAMALLADRQSIQQFIYGRTGIATPNFLNNPAKYRSNNLKMEFNVDKANAILDGAGWKKGADGIREKGGKKMKFVFQTSVNGIRQKEQAVIKGACQKAGIDLELKSVTASVFFSSDVANPDTYGKFWCDMQMYTTTQTQPDPERFMNQYVTEEISSKANKWQGRNIARWRSDEYDRTFKMAEGELDPVKRAALFIKLNDLVCKDNAIIPLISRPRVRGAGNKLVTTLSGWDLDFSQLQNWYREA
ncbi:peptide ABC transporter substrate-binding protein [Caenimonas aquaedulcis]|uniref:Peptide ABC transporter substrate-binding protein n=1 Tax=Caenimonas aquaedulcis TaxID=2793270 RepID=A0A931H468_9BURK|nr:peptide ABC transporter substrate-binding protein [Caenimonas aquaedulcis]MBG9388296.1 peptide ABC transporter substrate-binding protein [Caenimonas aquaedulcis]